MRRYLLLFIILFLSMPLWAQLEVKKGSFKEVPGFVNINSDPNYQTDDNENPFAVIMVRTENITDKQRRQLAFKGNAGTFIMLEYKDGEVWVYLTAKYADFLKISNPDLSSIEFTIPFDLQPKKGYEMTLVNKTVAVSEGWASLTIQTTPENGAKILLNGRDLNATTPYTNNMLAAGKYEIIVSKEKFETTSQTIDIQDGDNIIVEIEMPYLYGELYVTSEPSGANVIIDGTNYGVTPAEITTIVVGAHELKLEKAGCAPVYKTITIYENNKLIVDENLPTGPVNKTYTVNGVAFEMIAVKGSTFTMGGIDQYAYDSEKPTHQVTVSDFMIGKFEVTQKLWKAVMGNNPSYFNGDDLPVEQVSWNDVQEFIRKMNLMTGQNFRLPTEAEWEYAARGDSNTSLYNGEDIMINGQNNSPNLDKLAWYTGNCGRNYTSSAGCDVLNGYDISGWGEKQYSDSKGGTHPVGLKQPNAYGLYDMLGNVWEWCQDWYGDYSRRRQTNPKGPSSGSHRVLRGGSWGYGARTCRVSFRYSGDPVDSSDGIGFRLVSDVE